MACQLQYPHDAHDTEDLDDASDVLKLFRAVAGAVQTQRQVERQDRQNVNEVQRTLTTASDTLFSAFFKKKYCSSWKPTSELQSVICHMESMPTTARNRLGIKQILILLTAENSRQFKLTKKLLT